MDNSELEYLSTDMLRTKARERAKQLGAGGGIGTAIAYASKASLITYIKGSGDASVLEKSKAFDEASTRSAKLDHTADATAYATSSNAEWSTSKPRKKKTTKTEESAATDSAESSMGDIEKAIFKAAADAAKAALGGVDIEERIKAAVEKASAPKAITVEYKASNGTTKDLGVNHRKLPVILELCRMRLNVYLPGPAGSGKTSIAATVAKALDLPFYPVSVCATTTEGRLLGYMTVGDNPTYVETSIYKAYTKGGVLLLDEFDLGNPACTAVLNSILANGMASFPNGNAGRHPDFVVIVAANTLGRGADRRYVGRSEIDAATLDRFVFVSMDYDKSFEASLLGVEIPQSVYQYRHAANGKYDVDKWINRVDFLRDKVDKLGERQVIGMRAKLFGHKMLSDGFTKKAVEDLLFWDRMPAKSRERIESKKNA